MDNLIKYLLFKKYNKFFKETSSYVRFPINYNIFYKTSREYKNIFFLNSIIFNIGNTKIIITMYYNNIILLFNIKEM